MAEIISFGEITLDVIAVTPNLMPSESVSLLDRVHYSFGGRGANVALFASNQGIESLLLSSAGKDFVSSGYHQQLKDRGVCCDYVFIDHEGETTPKAFVFRDKSKTYTFFYPGVTELMKTEVEEHIKRNAEGLKAEVLYCTSGLQELNLFLLENMNARLKAYSPGPEITHYSKEELIQLLAVADCLFLNKFESDELRIKLGKSSADLNKDYNLKFHVVTLESNGSLIFEGVKEYFVRRCKPRIVVDGTGAGDSYAGSFLAEYLRSGSLKKAGEVASVVSSFVVEELGCQGNIPTKDQINERLKTY
ncbi:hypothetical protein DRJ22_05385, partial [Candidatus Woesearchaeota archaeon]